MSLDRDRRELIGPLDIGLHSKGHKLAAKEVARDSLNRFVFIRVHIRD